MGACPCCSPASAASVGSRSSSRSIVVLASAPSAARHPAPTPGAPRPPVFQAARFEARRRRPARPRPPRAADEGAAFVERALHEAGFRFGTDGTTRALWGYLRTSHRLVVAADARPGDILLFDTRRRPGARMRRPGWHRREHRRRRPHQLRRGAGGPGAPELRQSGPPLFEARCGRGDPEQLPSPDPDRRPARGALLRGRDALRDSSDSFSARSGSRRRQPCWRFGPNGRGFSPPSAGPSWPGGC